MNIMEEKTMEEKNNETVDELEQRVEELKKEFEGLSKSQKELLLYRKIVETGKIEDNSVGFNSFYYNQDISSDELLCLIKAADIGFLKPLLVYTLRERNLEYQEVYKES